MIGGRDYTFGNRRRRDTKAVRQMVRLTAS